jgi:hypothetical protein
MTTPDTTPKALRALAEQLQNLSGQRKLVPTMHGQMVGAETWRIQATGWSMECIEEAATTLLAIAEKMEEYKPTPGELREAVQEVRRYVSERYGARVVAAAETFLRMIAAAEEPKP